MSLSAGQVMITQAKILFAGEFAVHTFYHTLAADSAIDIDLYFSPMCTVMDTYLPPLMVEEARIVQVKSWLRGNPNPFETRIRNQIVEGTVLGDGLPAFVSATLIEVPNNATRWPATAQAFRPGRIAFTGVPESANLDGTLMPAYAALLQAFGNAIMSVPDTSGFGDPLLLFLDRTYAVKTSSGLARAYVDSVHPGRIGTQNTRKS